MTFFVPMRMARDSQFFNGDSKRYNNYWMISKSPFDPPIGFGYKFCEEDKHKGATELDSLNHWVCLDCMKPRLCMWPIFIVECDECGEPFFIKRYPIVYHLCSNCGGD